MAIQSSKKMSEKEKVGEGDKTAVNVAHLDTSKGSKAGACCKYGHMLICNKSRCMCGKEGQH